MSPVAYALRAIGQHPANEHGSVLLDRICQHAQAEADVREGLLFKARQRSLGPEALP